MKFIDSIAIRVRAGHGGSGVVSFRRERNMPKMGPDGGNGGNGGNVFLVGDEGLNTLSTLRFQAEYRSEDGSKGGDLGWRTSLARRVLLRIARRTRARSRVRLLPAA